MDIGKARQLGWSWPDIAQGLGLPRDAAGPLCTASFRLRRRMSLDHRKPPDGGSKKTTAVPAPPLPTFCDPRSVEGI